MTILKATENNATATKSPDLGTDDPEGHPLTKITENMYKEKQRRKRAAKFPIFRPGSSRKRISR